ncbi:hypothetical protein Adt_36040 [Abeliophyllum distichum]|uniref:Uncharacterized protein n=1 Tax=Abeliophyllum distichum TaxID=126358 RepID=A0ABD1QHD4_9LAMI
MADKQIPEVKTTKNLPPPMEPPKIPTGSSGSGHSSGPHYPNPPDSVNPDAATLRDQWRFAIRQYSKWYSHAWGTAILAGMSIFALGWIIKGSNPLHSFKQDNPNRNNSESSSSRSGDKEAAEVHQGR